MDWSSLNRIAQIGRREQCRQHSIARQLTDIVLRCAPVRSPALRECIPTTATCIHLLLVHVLLPLRALGKSGGTFNFAILATAA